MIIEFSLIVRKVVFTNFQSKYAYNIHKFHIISHLITLLFKQGADSISDYAITFHYVSVQDMYDLEFFVYHLRPYGIQNGLQDLNVKRDDRDKYLRPQQVLLPPALKNLLLKNRKENEIER